MASRGLVARPPRVRVPGLVLALTGVHHEDLGEDGAGATVEDAMGYEETFIVVAADCPVETAVTPTPRGGKPTIATIQYELLSARPYALTQEDVLFETHLRHKAVPGAHTTDRRDELRAEFFGKPQPCLRSSPLPKRYGWGLHFDARGCIGLWPMESDEYQRLAGGERGVDVLQALRTKRA